MIHTVKLTLYITKFFITLLCIVGIISSSRLHKISCKTYVNIKDILKDGLKLFYANTHLNALFVKFGMDICTYGLLLYSSLGEKFNYVG